MSAGAARRSNQRSLGKHTPAPGTGPKYLHKSKHADWLTQKVRGDTWVIIKSPIPVSRNVQSLSINCMITLNTTPLGFIFFRVLQQLQSFPPPHPHPGAPSGSSPPLFLGPLTTEGPIPPSDQTSQLPGLPSRIAAFDPYMPFLQTRSALCKWYKSKLPLSEVTSQDDYFADPPSLACHLQHKKKKKIKVPHDLQLEIPRH